jgi:glycosyltransferase involved in cell wall biosynthesis
VFVPSLASSPQPDGLFDLVALGDDPERWPPPDRARWPAALSPRVVLVDPDDPSAKELVGVVARGTPVVSVRSAPPVADATAILDVVPRIDGVGRAAGEGPGPYDVGMYVPVNPLAAAQRHNGLGFTGYLLVLTDRPGRPDSTPPTPAVAWLTAGFAREHVVVVEGGRATVWRGRARRGEVAVDSRTDLWRLMAHARLVADLAPGTVVARECVEAMRFGVPVIVPSDSAAAAIVHSGGGAAVHSVDALCAVVEQLLDEKVRAQWGAIARRIADARFGSSRRFVAAVADALGQIEAA